jgi:hypothetical protein
MGILIGFLGYFSLGLIIGTIILITFIKLYKTFKNK